MTCRRSFILTLPAVLCAAWAGRAPAQAQAQAPLTSLAEVKRLSLTEAESGRVPVKLRGFNLAPSRFAARSQFVQDAESLTAVYASLAEMPAANTLVEITGVTRTIRPRGFEELAVEVQQVRLIARDSVPQPQPVRLEELTGNTHRDRWVQTEGTVIQMRIHEGDTHVFLAGERGAVTFLFRGLPAPELPAAWLHARLRVRGMGLGVNSSGHHLAVHGLMNVLVTAPGTADAFACTEAAAAALLQARTCTGERRRLTATVLHATPSLQWLRGSDGVPLTAEIYNAWPPASVAPQLTSAVPPVPLLHPGDVVEVAGSPLTDERDGLRLRYAHVRVTASDGSATPRAGTGEELKAGAHRNDLVTLRGRVTAQSVVTLSPGRLLETLRLVDGDGSAKAETEVLFHTAAAGGIPRFSPDDLVEVTGIVQAAAASPGSVLMLRSARDIASLGLAPEVARLRQWRNTALIGGAALLAGGVILVLRRRLVRERALAGEIRLLNTTLEERVAERTAQLEQAREELRAALREEREVGELKTRFVSTVSHEFRTPLGVIMSATDILARYRDRLPPERLDEHLLEIRHATRHMSGMMEDILLLGRAGSGRLPVSPQPVDLLELCQRLADETRSAAAQTGPTVITSAPLPGPAAVDETILRHMFTNLVGNAVKYSPPGTPVEVHLSEHDGHAVITVADRGIGIPAEDVPRLFQPFARAGNVGARPGTGLGLVVVQRCAELHGGRVSHAPRPGGGSVFTLTIPAWTSPPRKA